MIMSGNATIAFYRPTHGTVRKRYSRPTTSQQEANKSKATSSLSLSLSMGGSRGGHGVRTPPPLKNHKNIGFLNNTAADPLKSQSYQASIQCWAVIGTPA